MPYTTELMTPKDVYVGFVGDAAPPAVVLFIMQTGERHLVDRLLHGCRKKT